MTPPAQPLNVSAPIAISHLADGRQLVYRAGGSVSAGGPLMVRSIGQLDARPLAGITNAYAPFFSPDSQWIGFFEKGEIRKVSTAGGPAITLGPFAGATLGASWGEDDTIVFGTGDPNTGLWRVPAAGGPPVPLTKPDTEHGEADHGFPSVLPGGRFVLFTIAAEGRTDTSQVVALDLETGQRKTLIRGGSQAEYIDASEGSRQGGYLVYATARTLRAVRFDPVRLDVLGDPVTVVEQVMMKPSGAALRRVALRRCHSRGPFNRSVRARLVRPWNVHEAPTGSARSYGPPPYLPTCRVGSAFRSGNPNLIWIRAGDARAWGLLSRMDGWRIGHRRPADRSVCPHGLPNVYMQPPRPAPSTGLPRRLEWPTRTTRILPRLIELAAL